MFFLTPHYVHPLYSYPIASSTELPFLKYHACAATTNPVVLHYGALLQDPDRLLFKQDMVRERVQQCCIH
jgi:hypothetical protein